MCYDHRIVNPNSEANGPAREPHPDGVVCPKCLHANSEAAAFCADCGAPIGMVATIDPIQHIHAEGFGYRSAVEGPPKLIIVIGMWLIFGPTVLVVPFIIRDASSFGDPGSIFFGLIVLCYAIILYRTTKNYIVKSRVCREPARESA